MKGLLSKHHKENNIEKKKKQLKTKQDYLNKSPATNREVDWFKIGFSPRKANFSLYLSLNIKSHETSLKKLGKHKTGVGCLYINKLDDVDPSGPVEIGRGDQSAHRDDGRDRVQRRIDLHPLWRAIERESRTDDDRRSRQNRQHTRECVVRNAPRDRARRQQVPDLAVGTRSRRARGAMRDRTRGISGSDGSGEPPPERADRILARRRAPEHRDP